MTRAAFAVAWLCVACVVATPQPLRDSFRGWKKRVVDQKSSSEEFGNDLQHHDVPSPFSVFSTQLMLRSPRGQRQYDVPQIECPPADDGLPRFACPTPDRQGRYHCIEDHVLCDGFIDCPAAEDEDREACMFYKVAKAHLDVLADAILRWTRGR